MRKRKIILAIILLVVSLGAIFLLPYLALNYKFAIITLPQGQELMVEVADDTMERSIGLSLREDVGIYDGMLFYYRDSESRRFTMSGMQFSIDLIWILDNTIIGIEEDLPYDEVDAVHRPYSPGPVNMVLEVKSDFLLDNELKVGDQLDIFLIQ